MHGYPVVMVADGTSKDICEWSRGGGASADTALPVAGTLNMEGKSQQDV